MQTQHNTRIQPEYQIFDGYPPSWISWNTCNLWTVWNSDNNLTILDLYHDQKFDIPAEFWYCAEFAYQFGRIISNSLIPVHLSRSLYLTLVEPYINYCNIIWAGSSNSGSLDRILRVQKEYCRLITFPGFTAHSRPLFEELFILTVYGIYKYQLSIFMYKLLNNLMPDHIVKRFVFYENSQIHTYATRHSSAFHSEFCRTSCRQSSVRMQGRKLWNELPLDIKKLTLIVFKKTLKRCIIFNQIDWTIVIYKFYCANFSHAPAFYAHYCRVMYIKLYNSCVLKYVNDSNHDKGTGPYKLASPVSFVSIIM